MTTAQLQEVTRDADDRFRLNFVRARFEALAEWDIPTGDAIAIANATEVDIVAAVRLIKNGCPPDLVLGILA
jgi:hypothetical protein